VNKKDRISETVFAYNYVIHQNVFKASKLANPRLVNKQSIENYGQRLLKKPNVQSLISNLIAQIHGTKEELCEKAKQILGELDVVGFLDLRNVFSKDTEEGKMLHSMGDAAKAVSRIKITENKIGGNVIGVTRELWMHNKLEALNLYGKHYKLYTEVMHHEGEIKSPNQYSLPDNGMSKPVNVKP
jgi:hypothetical protein